MLKIDGYKKLFLYEPLESGNKIFKKFREQFARKGNRRDNLFDVFWRVSVCSDPLLLNNFFKLKRNLRQKTPLPKAITDLLKETQEGYMK